MKALDREGKEVRLKAVDTLLAQALEHEIDHINGMLYIDYLTSEDELIPVRPSVDDGEEGEGRALWSNVAPQGDESAIPYDGGHLAVVSLTHMRFAVV